jgi:hypothetical protein
MRPTRTRYAAFSKLSIAQPAIALTSQFFAAAKMRRESFREMDPLKTPAGKDKP